MQNESDGLSSSNQTPDITMADNNPEQDIDHHGDTVISPPKGDAEDAIPSPSFSSISAHSDASSSDESEEDDPSARYDEKAKNTSPPPADVRIQLLKPDERLSQKQSLMQLFELNRASLDALLNGESETGKKFIRLMNTLDQRLWEPARQAAKEAGPDVPRPRGISFETVYQEYVLEERSGLQSYRDPEEEEQENWTELPWYVWYLYHALDVLWRRTGGPLSKKGLMEDAAAQRSWYLMRRWATDNTPSRRLRSKKGAATGKEHAAATSSKQQGPTATSSHQPTVVKPKSTNKKSKGKAKASKGAAGNKLTSGVHAQTFDTAQDNFAHPDMELSAEEDPDAEVIPQTTKPLVIEVVNIDPDVLLNDMREICRESIPKDVDGSPTYEWFDDGTRRIRRFTYSYQAWHFVESCFGNTYDDRKGMDTVRQIILGNYGHCDQSGAHDITNTVQEAAVEEAQVLSTMATDLTLAKEARREEGALLSFSAIEDTKRPQTFDWVEQMMNDERFQHHDYAGAMKRLHLKDPYPQLKGMSEGIHLHWWQVLGIDKIEQTRLQGQVKGIILADYVGLGKTLQLTGWVLHVSCSSCFPL
jgi:hypothetical protein